MTGLTKITKSMRSEDVNHAWHLVDMRGKVLGRTLTQVSTYLIGKHKPDYTAHVDNGDYVVVINAQDLVITGRKAEQKIYTRYSGYPGGLKETNFNALMQKDATKVVKNAVYGMLPKNRLRDKRITRLFVFTGDTHPYTDKFTK